MKNLLYRVLTSLVILPVVLASLFLGGTYFATLLLFVSVIACFEAARIIHCKSAWWIMLTMVFSVVLFIPAVLFREHGFIISLFTIFVIFHGIVLFSPSIKQEDFEKLCSIFYWSAYINLGLASIYWLISTEALIERRAGISLVLVACLATWSNDTFAYFCGRLFGKRALFPRVSQKKTWEGFFAGGVLSIASVLLGYYLPKSLGFDWLALATSADLLWIALPQILLAPFGDLIESRFKRLYATKDSSHILPGHGGILDRIDGLLMVMPWTALYAFLIRPLW
ncbi:MAG TPA: phosphatidate cytidylyltransferase [Myxococcota bacterium]|nr:phosphatidate cytidylyltransferase [Myxococcota bacterium]